MYANREIDDDTFIVIMKEDLILISSFESFLIFWGDNKNEIDAELLKNGI